MRTNSSSQAARRLFLKQASAIAGIGVGTPFALNLAAMGEVAAQSASDYKALVCVFLAGGNDAFNTVLATDTDSWANYLSVRNQSGSNIALPANQLLSISPKTTQGRLFALHPRLQQLQGLFNSQKRLAILANVGPMIEPITKSQYDSKTRRLPVKLFSHNDQQATWQALGPEGTTFGWGGRIADQIASGNGQSMFTAISAAGNTVWTAGKTVKQYQVSVDGPIRYGTVPYPGGLTAAFNSPAVGATLEKIVQRNTTNSVFANDLVTISGRSISAEKVLSQYLPAATDSAYGGTSELQYLSPKTNTLTNNDLAQQLQIVARVIGSRTGLNMKRQVFFVSTYGFDTHDNQTVNHTELMAKLDHALSYFDNTLMRMGVSQQVTTFTASDFGRSFTSNGDGTDHGWGAHHFIMGGAVQGGDVHGAFPVLAAKNVGNNGFDGSADQLSNGVLLPKVSVDQYGATLARWMGLSDSQIADVFPNLRNFGSQAYLSFM